MDQAHSFMEFRVMHRTASAHRIERVMEAQNADSHTTLHTFYQIKEAPAEETGVSYIHSSLEPPCRREEKHSWTRSDSAAVRRHEEDRMKPENASTKYLATSLVWLHEVHQTAPLEVQEGRIVRWLREDTAARVGIDAADAMRFHLTEWPGNGYQWAVRVSKQLKESYTHKGFIILPSYAAHPASRLDVYDFVTKPFLPASAHDTGHYPPLSQELLT
jgi:hypothetical protein